MVLVEVELKELFDFKFKFMCCLIKVKAWQEDLTERIKVEDIEAGIVKVVSKKAEGFKLWS